MRTSVSVLLLTGLLLAAPSCRRSEALSSQERPPPAEMPTVEVVAAVRHRFAGRVPITGELRPVREVSIKSRIGGDVVDLRVEEGDRVRKGQLLARIAGSSQRAQLAGAQAAVAMAEAARARAVSELERIERDRQRIEALYEKGAIDRKTLDDIRSAARLAEAAVQGAEAQVRQARAGLSAARTGVADTVYRAPFDGIVSRRGVQLHEYLDTMKNREIVAIVDNSEMELQGAVASSLAVGIEPGARVEFEVGALRERSVVGQVVAVSPVVDPRTRTVRLRVRVPNPEGRLKGGMYATGYVAVGGERETVGVPAHAVHHEEAAADGGEERSVVWRVREGTAEKVVVQTGAQDGDLVEIVSGIQAGDLVVVSSPGALRPGTAVRTKVP
ncbi:MAG: efflux RND transporter periplasmic adaptor subunit [Myxococcales bacterium]|nr:efflux RND transporter periplasmic adaptor subunit [Myxococcota bacterium]MDW8283446.1 efflux RND transporter periplasmic adaptor subunit [Myxococcales bacterium]